MAPRTQRLITTFLVPTWFGLSETPPDSGYGKQCVEKWKLSAPYDLSLTDDQWENYWIERNELEVANTRGTKEYSKTFWDGEQGTFQHVDELRVKANELLSEVFSKAAFLPDDFSWGTNNSGGKVKIAIETALKGSLYFMGFGGKEGVE